MLLAAVATLAASLTTGLTTAALAQDRTRV